MGLAAARLTMLASHAAASFRSSEVGLFQRVKEEHLCWESSSFMNRTTTWMIFDLAFLHVFNSDHCCPPIRPFVVELNLIQPPSLQKDCVMIDVWRWWVFHTRIIDIAFIQDQSHSFAISADGNHLITHFSLCVPDLRTAVCPRVFRWGQPKYHKSS